MGFVNLTWVGSVAHTTSLMTVLSLHNVLPITHNYVKHASLLITDWHICTYYLSRDSPLMISYYACSLLLNAEHVECRDYMVYCQTIFGIH